MSFCATLNNVTAFRRLVTSVEKLSARSVLKLTKDTLYIICLGAGGVTGEPQAWAHAKVESLFSDLEIESDADDEIFLEFVPAILARILRSSQDAAGLSIELSEHPTLEYPVLHFVFQNVGVRSLVQEVVQDLPVKVLSPEEIKSNYKEPVCPEPDVHISLPDDVAMMRGVVEKMKNLDNLITVLGNNQVQLHLRVESEYASVETAWRDLTRPDIGDPGNEEADIEMFHGVQVDAKHLLKILNAFTEGTHAIACICSGHALVVMFLQGGSNAGEEAGRPASLVTFYVPGRSRGS